MPHIEFEQISDFVLGEIETGKKAEIAGHLAACPMCAMQKKQLERTLETMRSDQSEDVPNYLSARVFDMFESNLPPLETVQNSVLEKIYALVQFDKIVPVLGLRSGQEEQIRLIKSVAQGIEITLQIIQKSENEWNINARVLSEIIPFKVELYNSEEILSADINDFGEFSLDAVKPGKYNLSVRIGNTEIELSEILIN